jgi:hypothetical protein
MGLTESAILAFNDNPFAWGMYYFPHHFRGPSPAFHQKIIEEAVCSKYLAIASPRESAKSTILTFLFPAHQIAFKRKHLIILIQSNLAKAVRSLETIKKEFRENRLLIDDYRIEFRKDNESDTIFKHRDGFEVEVICAGREQIGGLRGSKFGAYRPDLVLIDDVEDDEMVRNPERRADLQRVFDDVVMLLGKDESAQVVVVGTILHDDSQLAKLIDRRQYFEFRKLLYRGRNKLADGSYKSLWEYKWTVDDLNLMEKENPVKFAKEIQNDPSTGLMQDICVEDFRTWHIDAGEYVLLDNYGRITSRGDLRSCKAAIACDLAWDDTRQSDYNAIVPAYLTPQADILIEDYIFEKGVRPDRLEEIIFTMEAKLRGITGQPVPIGFEKAKYEKIMQYLLKLAMRKRNKALWFKPLQWDNDKITRIITRLQPRYKQHMIYHKKGMGDLEAQLTRIRSAAHDDLADAVQGLVQLLEYPRQVAAPKEKDDNFMWWRQQAIKFRSPKKEAYVFGRRKVGEFIDAKVSFR